MAAPLMQVDPQDLGTVSQSFSEAANQFATAKSQFESSGSPNFGIVLSIAKPAYEIAKTSTVTYLGNIEAMLKSISNSVECTAKDAEDTEQSIIDLLNRILKELEDIKNNQDNGGDNGGGSGDGGTTGGTSTGGTSTGGGGSSTTGGSGSGGGSSSGGAGGGGSTDSDSGSSDDEPQYQPLPHENLGGNATATGGAGGAGGYGGAGGTANGGYTGNTSGGTMTGGNTTGDSTGGNTVGGSSSDSHNGGYVPFPNGGSGNGSNDGTNGVPLPPNTGTTPGGQGGVGGDGGNDWTDGGNGHGGIGTDGGTTPGTNGNGSNGTNTPGTVPGGTGTGTGRDDTSSLGLDTTGDAKDDYSFNATDGNTHITVNEDGSVTLGKQTTPDVPLPPGYEAPQTGKDGSFSIDADHDGTDDIALTPDRGDDSRVSVYDHEDGEYAAIDFDSDGDYDAVVRIGDSDAAYERIRQEAEASVWEDISRNDPLGRSAEELQSLYADRDTMTLPERTELNVPTTHRRFA